MKLTKGRLERICGLSGLTLSCDEAEAMALRLGAALELFQELDGFDTTPPELAEEAQGQTALRVDRILPSLSREALLKTVPDTDGKTIFVPKTRAEGGGA